MFTNCFAIVCLIRYVGWNGLTEFPNQFKNRDVSSISPSGMHLFPDEKII